MGYLSKPTADKKPTRRTLTGVCSGANVRTPMGARRIELVRPGDLIVTRDNGLQPVKQIWKRTLTEVELARASDLAPICLQPRAIGPMMPTRPLRIAPGHRALIPGYRIADVVLAAADRLEMEKTIAGKVLEAMPRHGSAN